MAPSSRRDRIVGLLAECDGKEDLGLKICALCSQLTGVSGVAMTVMTSDGQRGLVHAADSTARCLDNVQLTLAEGPCVTAFATRGPVLVPDLDAVAPQRWPEFIELVAPAIVGAVFSFTLQIGAARLGTLDLYRDTAGSLSEDQLADGLVCADLATQTLLASPTNVLELANLDNVDTHAHVSQATGRVMVQLSVNATEALLLMRLHAFATGRPITEVAHDVNGNRLLMEGEEV